MSNVFEKAYEKGKRVISVDGDGAFIKIGSLQDRGYKFKSYQEWAQDALK